MHFMRKIALVCCPLLAVASFVFMIVSFTTDYWVIIQCPGVTQNVGLKMDEHDLCAQVVDTGALLTTYVIYLSTASFDICGVIAFCICAIIDQGKYVHCNCFTGFSWVLSFSTDFAAVYTFTKSQNAKACCPSQVSFQYGYSFMLAWMSVGCLLLVLIMTVIAICVYYLDQDDRCQFVHADCDCCPRPKKNTVCPREEQPRVILYRGHSPPWNVVRAPVEEPTISFTKSSAKKEWRHFQEEQITIVVLSVPAMTSCDVTLMDAPVFSSHDETSVSPEPEEETIIDTKTSAER